MPSQTTFIRTVRCIINISRHSAFVRIYVCWPIILKWIIQMSAARTSSWVKRNFTSMRLLFDALLGLFAIVIAPSLSPNVSTQIPVLMKSAFLDASHNAKYSASRVEVVRHFSVDLFQPISVSPSFTATPDTDIWSLDIDAKTTSTNTESLRSGPRMNFKPIFFVQITYAATCNRGFLCRGLVWWLCRAHSRNALVIFVSWLTATSSPLYKESVHGKLVVSPRFIVLSGT